MLGTNGCLKLMYQNEMEEVQVICITQILIIVITFFQRFFFAIICRYLATISIIVKYFEF